VPETEIRAEIPEYTYDEFMVGTAPFEYVYRFAGNEFEHRRMIDRMTKKAQSVNVKNFATLYKGYLKSVSIRDSRPVGNYSDFGGQTIQLMTGKWIADEYRIFTTTNTGDMIACTHPIMPIGRIVNVDSGLEKLNLAFKRGGKWRKDLIIDKAILASPQKILELASSGISVTSENAKNLISYLQDVEALNYDEIPEKKSASRLGWIDGYGFAPYEEGLIFDGDVNFKNMFRAVSSRGSREEWMKIALEMRKKDIVARIILAASLASILVKPCDTLSFFIHLWAGQAGTGKTVVAMFASSVWGNPEMGEYTQSFNATAVAMERMAEFYNSLPIVMDELQLINDGTGKIRFNPYKLAQGLGKGRGTKIGGIEKTPTWKLCIITTGETPLTNLDDGAGAFARILDIELDRIIISAEDGNRIVRTINHNYGFIGREFVEIAKEVGDDNLQKRYSDKVLAIMLDETIQDKQAMAAALLLLADELATDRIFSDDMQLTIDEIKPYLMDRKDASVEDRAYDFICEWVAANDNRMKPSEHGEQYGVVDRGYAFIIASKLTGILKESGYNQRSVLSGLRKKGLIVSCKDGDKTRNAVKKTIGEIRIWCVGIKLPGESYTGRFD
jgi:hypothetical protein